MRAVQQAARRWLTLALASGFFVSYLPAWFLRDRRLTGAGLTGSVWGVCLLPCLPVAAIPQMMVWAGGFAVSVAISDAAEEYLATTDDPRIVIDEMIGLWTAMLFLPRSRLAIALAFIFFRFFDTWKPAGIKRLGDLPGGWGVVIDDVAAGAAANLVLRLIQFFHPL